MRRIILALGLVAAFGVIGYFDVKTTQNRAVFERDAAINCRVNVLRSNAGREWDKSLLVIDHYALSHASDIHAYKYFRMRITAYEILDRRLKDIQVLQCPQ